MSDTTKKKYSEIEEQDDSQKSVENSEVQAKQEDVDASKAFQDYGIQDEGEEGSEQSKPSEVAQPQVRMSILFLYVLALSPGLLQTAWALCGNTHTAGVFAVKFGWDENQAMFWNSMINSSAVFGLMIGSLFGGKLIVGGRRRATFIAAVIVIVGGLFTQYLSIATLCIGRFLMAYASGVFN